ncbi:MAG: hypothetical protein Ct9H300mP19_01620 [Dehalococcoidia bacterium]|nr:MAG: hypothetical protein Ct9H300mP19_01620 [Dehalococcoidia bacterium]
MLSEIWGAGDQARFHKIFVDMAEEITLGHDSGTDAHFHKWVELGLSRIDPDLPYRIGGSGITQVGDAIDKAFLDSRRCFLKVLWRF